MMNKFCSLKVSSLIFKLERWQKQLYQAKKIKSHRVAQANQSSQNVLSLLR